MKKSKKPTPKKAKKPTKAKKPKKKASRKSKKREIKDSLPNQIKVDGFAYNTPSRLRSLRHNGQIISDEVRLSVYAIYIRNKRKKPLSVIVDTLYSVRDKFIDSGGTYRPVAGTLEHLAFKFLGMEYGYLIRNEILDKIQSIHESYPNIKTYKWQCFLCRKKGFFTFGEAMAQTDIELRYMWDSREIYLNDVDSGSVSFGVMYYFDSLTKYAFINFNDIIFDGGHLDTYKQILTKVKNENEQE